MAAQFHGLTAGEPIGVIALSGPPEAEKLRHGLEVVRSWGHAVIEAENLYRKEPGGYLAGDDENRLRGLESLLEDGVRCFVAARGGYGVMRLLPRLPWDKLVEREAVLVGFSDLTPVLNHLAAHGVAQVHGPMAAAGLADPMNAARLHAVVAGTAMGRELFEFEENQVIVGGSARGRLVGGNLAMMCSTLGTPWEPSGAGAILALEDVDEPLYRLDRMLTQLRLSGSLNDVKALIYGDLQDLRNDWGHVGGLLREAAPGVPIVMGLPFGHGKENFAFPIGAEVELDTEAGRLVWRA